MKNKRFFMIMSGVFVCTLLLIGACGFLGLKQLTKKSTDLKNIRSQQEIAEQQKMSQSQAKKDIEKYADLNKLTKAIVPQDKDQAKTVREINSIAKNAGVSLQTINFSSSTLGQSAKATAQNSATDSANSANTPTATAPNITQVKPVTGVNGVYAMEITIANSDSTSITYAQLIDFLSKLEGNRRTAHVEKISVTPKKGGRLVFNITLNAYVKP